MIGSRSPGLRRERVLASPQHQAGGFRKPRPAPLGPRRGGRGAADPAAAFVLSDAAPSYD